PGTDLVWICAVTRDIIENGLHKTAFIEKWVHGFEDYRKSLEPFTLDFAEMVTGIPAETLQRVAQMIAEADKVCILWGMGTTQHCHGADTSTAISNLLLVTGNYMRRGTGAYPLRGHNNVQGASDFGSMPDYYPGYEKVEDPVARARCEKEWGAKLP